MNTTLSPCDFKGTGIKTAFEQMRANAIINAENNKRGISIINFNLTAFLHERRQNDLLFILKNWAVQPLRKDLSRFKFAAREGQKALEHRAQQLANHLSARNDITQEAIKTALSHMNETIAEEISLLRVAESA